jgi:hypothetical protein
MVVVVTTLVMMPMNKRRKRKITALMMMTAMRMAVVPRICWKLAQKMMIVSMICPVTVIKKMESTSRTSSR